MCYFDLLSFDFHFGEEKLKALPFINKKADEKKVVQSVKQIFLQKTKYAFGIALYVSMTTNTTLSPRSIVW